METVTNFQTDNSVQNLILESTDSQTFNSVQELMGDIAIGYKKTLEDSRGEGWAELQKNRLDALEGKNFSVMPWNEVLEILSGKWQPPPPPVVETKPKRTRKAAAKKSAETKVMRLTPATMPWGEMLKILAGKATLASLAEEEIEKVDELKDPKDKWKNNATRSPVESINEFIEGFAFE
jgi:hypothetical protein